jgi:glycosyltransferase involved in cell wall biosynthesis
MTSSPILRPRVSVALATRNGARYLRQQLDSIYAQTEQDFEVVVADDASTDGTLDLLGEFATARGLRFSESSHPVGLVQNFERALRLCRGEFIALCDQDDLWKPRRLERLLSSIGDSALIYCNTEEQLDLSGKVYLEPRFAPAQDFSRRHGSGQPTKFLLADNWIVGHSMLMRREVLDVALPIPAGQRFHDAWLALVASTVGTIRYLDERLQIYRNHPDSLTFKSADAPAAGRGLFSRFVDGEMRAAWEAKRQSEAARLSEVDSRLKLGHSDREVLRRLRTYFHSGSPWAAARAGLAIAPFFANERRSPLSRARIVLRPLLAAASPRGRLR